MNDKWSILGEMLLLSTFVSTCLHALARRGRNMRRFGDRQQFQDDLYRFTVTIVCSLALYLVGKDLEPLRLFPLPDGVLLFATTALPTLLLCLLSGRWYVGYAAVLLVEGFILSHVQTSHPGALNGTTAYLLLQNALCDLVGLCLYALISSWKRRDVSTATAIAVETRQQNALTSLQKAGHGK